MATMPRRKIVSDGRHRKSLGDIAGLAASIRDVGLLHPVVVMADGRLVAGERRLAALDMLGWADVPVTVAASLADAAALLRAERDENVCRLDFAPSEAVAAATALEALERPAAKRREQSGKGPGGSGGRGKKKPCGNLPQGSAPKTRDVVAAAVGMSGRTLEKAKAVVASGDEELIATMDHTGKVAGAYSKMQRERKREELKAKAAAAPVVAPDDRPWQIIVGDCIEELAKLEPGSARLVFADPPYNIGVDYGDGHDDRLSDAEYVAWCGRWIAASARVLADDGSMWVLIGDEYADYIGLELRKAGLHRRHWIKWYESFGVNVANGFNRCSRHLFYCVKDPTRFVFNADAVNRPSDRQTKYGDARANPEGKTWDDVWGISPAIPRVVGTAKERIPDFPTQLPLALLRPIIGCASEPGDLVLDPFNGSGTTGAAAVQAGRRYIGIERSSVFAAAAELRLKVEATPCK